MTLSHRSLLLDKACLPNLPWGNYLLMVYVEWCFKTWSFAVAVNPTGYSACLHHFLITYIASIEFTVPNLVTLIPRAYSKTTSAPRVLLL
ncbi:hypothetical protein BDV35DRAFT_374716 [Aspergillus flavus]|uniref:Uncharacterized protein n=1 Tax=Aspergillus flavus TaxID=5059 RepID=A0A5N6GFB9_ASPFL|nr:hypothetical protein BDV35DRAFT_374716 [Aspergillus flavus]